MYNSYIESEKETKMKPYTGAVYTNNPRPGTAEYDRQSGWHTIQNCSSCGRSCRTYGIEGWNYCDSCKRKAIK